MKLFVDTGSVKDVEALAALGILDGVTTNPSLLAKESADYRQILKQICQIVKGPVSGEVVATDYAGMMTQGRKIASIDEHMVVKVPFTKDGVKACKTLSSEGTRVNVTLIFSATQAWLAAKAGASYVSPFVGRLDDIGAVGMTVVREIVDTFDNSEYATEVLVASVRSPIHVIDAARMGADVASTCPVMMMSDICIVNGISSQKPDPQASMTCTRLDGVAVTPAMITMSVPIKAKMNASGTYRSVHAVSASAERATRPVSVSVPAVAASDVCESAMR